MRKSYKNGSVKEERRLSGKERNENKEKKSEKRKGEKRKEGR